MTKLHDEDFMTRHGVNIANICMESFKIMDMELANKISQNCLTTAHVENQLLNLQGRQNLIATQKEQTAADYKKIKALAKNKRSVDAAKAKVESSKFKLITKVQAEADAILLKAKAEAEAIRLKLLSQTTLGQHKCLFEIYADMIKSSNKGVSKISTWIHPLIRTALSHWVAWMASTVTCIP
jgi:uncharacterized membrane protein YqiK